MPWLWMLLGYLPILIIFNDTARGIVAHILFRHNARKGGRKR